MSEPVGETRATPSASSANMTASDPIVVSVEHGCYAPIWIRQGVTSIEMDVREAGDLVALIRQAIKRVRDGEQWALKGWTAEADRAK